MNDILIYFLILQYHKIKFKNKFSSLILKSAHNDVTFVQHFYEYTKKSELFAFLRLKLKQYSKNQFCKNNYHGIKLTIYSHFLEIFKYDSFEILISMHHCKNEFIIRHR